MSEYKINIDKMINNTLPKLSNIMTNLASASSACESASSHLPSSFSDRGSVSAAISNMRSARNTINGLSIKMHDRISRVKNIESRAKQKEKALMDRISKSSQSTQKEKQFGSMARSLGLNANDIKNVKANTNNMLVTLEDGTTYSYRYTTSGVQLVNETHKDMNGKLESSISYKNGNVSKVTTYINNKIDEIKKYDSLGRSIISRDKYGYSDTDGSLLYIKQEIYTSRAIVTKCDVYLEGKRIGSLDPMALNSNMTIEELEKSGFFDFSDCTRMGDPGGRTQISDDEYAVLNRMVEASVEVNGKGTGKAVAAAAVTLIDGLKDLGIYIPYYLSGGHGGDDVTGLYTGVNPHLGETVAATGISTKRHVNGYDCSGFIMWAMRTAGLDIDHYGSANAVISGANTTKISETTAGDVLAKSDGGHVIMVLNTYEKDGEIYVACAESTTNKYGGTDDGGALFTEYTVRDLANMGYFAIDMEGAYSERYDDGASQTIEL